MSSWSGLGAGFKDSGRWDVTSYHVEFSLPAALIVVASAVSAQRPNPILCLLPLNRPSLPVFRVTALSVLDCPV